MKRQFFERICYLLMLKRHVLRHVLIIFIFVNDDSNIDSPSPFPVTIICLHKCVFLFVTRVSLMEQVLRPMTVFRCSEGVLTDVEGGGKFEPLCSPMPSHVPCLLVWGGPHTFSREAYNSHKSWGQRHRRIQQEPAFRTFPLLYRAVHERDAAKDNKKG